MPTITPFLWFDHNAQEAMTFYCAIFPDTKVISSNPMGVEFELQGQRFMGLNGGPKYKFTDAVSLFVSVETQAEIDEYWDKLLAGGGQPTMCGWLRDKYGLAWQVIPTVLPKLIGDPDRAKGQRAIEAMLKMQKIDIAELQRAHDGT